MSTLEQQVIEDYDEHHVLDNRLTMEWYPRRVAELAVGDSMLELGLGHGYTTSFFARHFRRYRVIDGSAEMIARFRSRFGFPDLDVVQSYFETYDSADRYDTIVMGFVLEHVDDPGAVLARYRRFLKPGGSVFVTVPNAESLHRRIGHAAGLLSSLHQLSDVDWKFGHVRYFDMSSLRALAASSGYVVAAAEGLFLKPVTTGQLESLSLSPDVLQALMKVGVNYPELCNSMLLQLKDGRVDA